MICPDCQHPDCDDCGAPMVDKHLWQRGDRPAGHVRVGAGGLCHADYLAMQARQKVLRGPEWDGPARAKHRPSVIGGWVEKHEDVTRAHSP